jgi:hypothetical protein
MIEPRIRRNTASPIAPYAAVARARGRQGGRPKALAADKRPLLVALYEQKTMPVKTLCAKPTP